MPRKANSLENILSKAKRAENDCLLYTASLDERGYGRVSFQNKTYPAHRVVYALYHGTVSPHHDIHHICHTKACVNIAHLDAVSHRENVVHIEKYTVLRTWRLQMLLAAYPQVEFVSLTLASTTLSALWDCRSDHVPVVLATMGFVYPQQFAWTLRKQGKGNKPALFEIRVQPSLIEHLCSETASSFLSPAGPDAVSTVTQAH